MFTPDVNGMLITGAETGAAAVAIRANVQELGNRARKSNYEAIVDPTTADNLSIGYRIGSRWINLATNQLFDCLFSDNTTAVWVNNTASLGLAASIGDGVALQFDIIHDLGTRDVIVQVYRDSAPYDEIDVYHERPTLDTVRVIFSSRHVPTTNEFRVVIRKI